MNSLPKRLNNIRPLDYDNTEVDSEHTRRLHMKEENERQTHRKRLDAIYEKAKKGGLGRLSDYELKLWKNHREYFKYLDKEKQDGN